MEAVENQSVDVDSQLVNGGWFCNTLRFLPHLKMHRLMGGHATACPYYWSIFQVAILTPLMTVVGTCHGMSTLHGIYNYHAVG